MVHRDGCDFTRLEYWLSSPGCRHLLSWNAFLHLNHPGPLRDLDEQHELDLATWVSRPPGLASHHAASVCSLGIDSDMPASITKNGHFLV